MPKILFSSDGEHSRRCVGTDGGGTEGLKHGDDVET